MMKLSKKNIIEVDKRIERLIYDNEDRPRYKVEVTKVFKDLFDVNYVGEAYTDDSRAAERVRIKLFDTANPKRLYDMLVAEDDYGRSDFRNFQIMIRLLSDIGRSKLSNTSKDEYFDKYRDILRMLRKTYGIRTLETIDSIGNPLKAAKRSLRDSDYDDDYYGYGSDYDSGRRKRRYSSFDDDEYDREPSDAYYDRILSGTGIGESRSKSKKSRKKYADIYDDIDDDYHDADYDDGDDYTKDDILEMTTQQIKDLSKVVASVANDVRDMKKSKVDASAGYCQPVRTYEPVATLDTTNTASEAKMQKAIDTVVDATTKNTAAINNMAANIQTLSANQNVLHESLAGTRELLNTTVLTVNSIIDDLEGADSDDDNVTVVTGTTIDEALAAADNAPEVSDDGDGGVNIVT